MEEPQQGHAAATWDFDWGGASSMPALLHEMTEKTAEANAAKAEARGARREARETHLRHTALKRSRPVRHGEIWDYSVNLSQPCRGAEHGETLRRTLDRKPKAALCPWEAPYLARLVQAAGASELKPWLPPRSGRMFGEPPLASLATPESRLYGLNEQRLTTLHAQLAARTKEIEDDFRSAPSRTFSAATVKATIGASIASMQERRDRAKDALLVMGVTDTACLDATLEKVEQRRLEKTAKAERTNAAQPDNSWFRTKQWSPFVEGGKDFGGKPKGAQVP